MCISFSSIQYFLLFFRNFLFFRAKFWKNPSGEEKFFHKVSSTGSVKFSDIQVAIKSQLYEVEGWLSPLGNPLKMSIFQEKKSKSRNALIHFVQWFIHRLYSNDSDDTDLYALDEVIGKGFVRHNNTPVIMKNQEWLGFYKIVTSKK